MVDTSLIFTLLARDRTGDGINSAESRLDKFSKNALKIAAVGAGALLAVGKAGMEGVLEGVAAEEAYADAVSRSSGKIKQQSDAFKEYAAEVQRTTKFTYEQTLAVGGVIAKHDSLNDVVNRGLVSQKDLAKVALNMATVMKVDGAQAAEILGKALAAPEKAAAMLRKQGISLDPVMANQLQAVKDAAAASQKLTLEGDKLKATERAKLRAIVKAAHGIDAQAIVLDALKKKTEGAADAAGNTLAGKLERAKNAFGEVQENLVVGFLPTVTKVLDKVLKMSKWAEENPAKFKAIAISIAAITGALLTAVTIIKVYTIVTRTITAVTAAWAAVNRVLAASQLAALGPIGLVIAAIAAIGVAFFIAYRKSETFRNIVHAVLNAVKTAAAATWQFMSAGFSRLAAAFKALGGVFGFVIKAISMYFTIWRTAFTTALKVASGMFSAVRNGFSALRSGIGAVVDGIRNKVVGVFTSIRDTVRGIINNLIGRINGFIGKANSVKNSKVASILTFGANKAAPNIGSIPMLAKGGNITRAGMAIVGEAGPELINLNRGASVTPLNKSQGGEVKVVFSAAGADKEMLALLKKLVRVEGGGNVQVALGRA